MQNSTKNSLNQSALRGHWAERFAEAWLQRQGLTPYSRNFTRRLGEIDLILRDESTHTWVFVEVKYRQSDAKVSALDAVDFYKQRKLQRTAELFLQQQRDSTSAARIDAVIITPCSVPLAQDSREQFANHHYDWVNGYQLAWIQNAIAGG